MPLPPQPGRARVPLVPNGDEIKRNRASAPEVGSPGAPLLAGFARGGDFDFVARRLPHAQRLSKHGHHRRRERHACRPGGATENSPAFLTTKSKKTKARKARPRRKNRIEIKASIEEDLLELAEAPAGSDARWNRPRKQRISLRVDVEVVDWLKSKGSGYQTRINRILRRVMTEDKKPGGRL